MDFLFITAIRFFILTPTSPIMAKLEIASWYYPLIGPYDSLDPAVLEYHVLLMKLAGIDGVIVDWYGQDNYYDYGINNQRTLALLNYARKAGLKFSLCYEDATIQAEINGGSMNGVNTATNAIAHAQQTMLYAQTNFFTDPSFLRLSNAPVLLNFGPQYFHNQFRLDVHFLRAERHQSAGLLHRRQPPVAGRRWRVRLAAHVAVQRQYR